MEPSFRRIFRVLALSMAFGGWTHAQDVKARKLGPDTAKSIGAAKLDPAFQTTKLNRVAVLPFANTAQHRDPATLISTQLVAQLSQLHPEYKFIPPDESINFVSSSGLNDEFNVFLGDYLASGTARKDFLDNLRNKLQIDAVLVGHITSWGKSNVPLTYRGRLTGKTRRIFLIGVDMNLYRTADGRRIWYGKDVIAPKNEAQLQQAGEVIGEVFARFFGRTPY